MNQLAPVLPDGYGDILLRLKQQIQAAQGRAGLAVNRELVLLYWQIGNEILQLQQSKGWGSKVVEHLSKDLQREFPGVQGFSTRNMLYMRKLAEQYPNEAIVQQVVAQLPWSHNVTLLDKFEDSSTRLWYAQKVIENGWSRNILIHQIESRLHNREASANTNFDKVLASPQSELAQKVLKDPYIFDFLSLGPEAREADVERGLIDHMKQFLLELGAGFAFVGSQYHLEVGGKDYYLDLLFYHLHLRCYVIVELKIGEFEPEHAGKMNFYLTAVDEQLKQVDDQASIGIIMCKTANSVVTRYALRNAERPIGVAEYRVTELLPDNFKEKLPTPDEIKDEFASGSLSLIDEVAHQNLKLIESNGLLFETATLLLACLKSESGIVHFNVPQRMSLHFNTKTKQVYLNDTKLKKFIVLKDGKVCYANLQAEEAPTIPEALGHDKNDQSNSEIVDATIIDVEKELLNSSKNWMDAFNAKHKIYRDADIEDTEFQRSVEEAKRLWKEECEAFLEKHGDAGACVRGEGIMIRYLGPRKRKWVERCIISPTNVMQRVTGSLVWEHSAQKIVDYLQAHGIDAFFNYGSID